MVGFAACLFLLMQVCCSRVDLGGPSSLGNAVLALAIVFSSRLPMMKRSALRSASGLSLVGMAEAASVACT